MVQAQDIHEANSSLETLYFYNNQVSDESHCIGPGLAGDTCCVILIALVVMLEAHSVITPTQCQLHDVLLRHVRNVMLKTASLEVFCG